VRRAVHPPPRPRAHAAGLPPKPRPTCEPVRTTLSILGSAGLALTGALAGFHFLLLWRRIQDLSLLQPGVALRWLVAAALLAAMACLTRTGGSLFRGRRALVLWLLVLLLHGGAVAPAHDTVFSVDPRGGMPWLLALPAGSLVLSLSRWIVEKLRNARGAPPAARAVPNTALTSPSAAGFALLRRTLPALASRPPPA
jgi:hypothetical protein